MRQTILIAGCGDLGNAIGERLLKAGHRVYGLRRNIAQLSDSIHPIAYDLRSNSPLPNLPAVDYLVYAAAAKSRDLEVYRSIYVDAPLKLMQSLVHPPKRVFMIGSTGVFAQNQHEWIDETSVAAPSNPFGEALLEGEQRLAETGQPLSVTRCSGIYGPGRQHLLDRIRLGIVAPEIPLHYSNRIHRDDAAAFLTHLINLSCANVALENLYLVSDSQPTPISEITHWLAIQLGVTPTQEEPIARGGSKRINNQRMLDTGFKLTYPSYIEGFKDLLASE